MLKPLLVAGALALAAVVSHAETATAPLPVSEYLKPSQFARPLLSPNGHYLAVTMPIRGRMNLAVVDLETRKATGLTSFDNFDVLDVVWVGNDRLMFSLGQNNSPTGPGHFDGGGLFVVSRDGKDSRRLSATVKEQRGQGQYVYRYLEVERTIPGNTDEVLVSGNLRSAEAQDIYRLNLNNGRTALVTSERPDRTSGWVLDSDRVPRVVTSWIKDTLVYVTYYRKDANSPWTEIARVNRAKGEDFEVEGFLSDNKTLMVSANPGRDTKAIYKFDPETKRFGEILAEHPRFDMTGGVITEPETDKLVGYVVQAERPQIVWTDEKQARIQAMIDKALPETLNRFRRVPNSKRLLVTSYSDVEPARWYILDEEKRTLEELFASKPWLDKRHLVEMRPFVLKTRDGLEIPSYYFLPKSYKPGDKLPTVFHIHGGPHARGDFWGGGFGYQEAQILASRGYAVVLPNFRVTPGFGAKIYMAGFGTVGRQMSEDHEDAAKWAIEQGFADPKRMCIAGASYGGYATLRALAKTPDLFKCGVAGAVLADIDRFLSSPNGDVAYNLAGVTFWHKLVGVEANPNALKENSPTNMAAQMKAPLFIWGGADDIRTPIEQTNGMVSALKSAGNPPKVVMIKKEEGHGYGRLENNIDLYEKMLDFLDAQIGPGSQR
jgi:dipeptidyl aminopeptidase/acylaminoacyl peptidase